VLHVAKYLERASAFWDGGRAHIFALANDVGGCQLPPDLENVTLLTHYCYMGKARREGWGMDRHSVQAGR
jgi:hypothetical protein